MLHKVRQQFRSWFRLTPREFRVVILVSGLFLLSALAYVWPGIRMVLLAYEHQSQQRIQRDLLRENTLLRLERDSLMSLDRIQALSRSVLKLEEPTPGQVVTVFLK
ncbi:MAG: hypothetical protein ACE5ER_01845 [Nitrospinaceae bacterium]